MPTQATYVILPASVRLDARLSYSARLLYGEISALCHQEGYCWAGNDYFADLYQVQPKVVSRWIQQLRKNGHIRVEIIRGNFRKMFALSDLPIREGTPAKEIEALPISIDDHQLKSQGQTPSYLYSIFNNTTNKIHRNNRQGSSTHKGMDKLKNNWEEEGNLSDVGRASSPSPPVAAAPPSQKSTSERHSKPQKPAFVKPTLKQVEDYMLSQRDLCPDAAVARSQAPRFVNYYEANGWKVGRNPMQDWQAAANNWLLNARQYQSGNSSQSGQSSKYSKRRPNAYLFTERDKDYGIPF